jgi:hypothetical protein
MNLNLSNSGGSGNYIRFSPQANAWTKKDEFGNDKEFQFPLSVFDHENVQTGWMLIATGQYEFLPDNSLGKKGAQPSAEHKRGFKVSFYSKDLDGVVEYSANGAGANMGLEELWKKVQAEAADNAGKLPVLEYKGSRPEKVGKGTTRVPEFDVVKWVARPAAMQDGAAAEPKMSAPATIAKPAPTPVAKPAPSKPAPSLDDDEMFS